MGALVEDCGDLDGSNGRCPSIEKDDPYVLCGQHRRGIGGYVFADVLGSASKRFHGM